MLYYPNQVKLIFQHAHLEWMENNGFFDADSPIPRPILDFVEINLKDDQIQL